MAFPFVGRVVWSKFINACRNICHLLREVQGRDEIVPTILPEMSLSLPAVPVRWR